LQVLHYVLGSQIAMIVGIVAGVVILIVIVLAVVVIVCFIRRAGKAIVSA